MQLREKSPSVNPICAIDWRRRLTNRRLNVVVGFLKVAIKWRASRDGETTQKTTGNRLTEGQKRQQGPRSGGDRSKQRDTLGSRLDDGAVDRQPVTKARGYVCIRMRILACTVPFRNARCKLAMISHSNVIIVNIIWGECVRKFTTIYSILASETLIWNSLGQLVIISILDSRSCCALIPIKNSQSSNFLFQFNAIYKFIFVITMYVAR